MRILHYLDDFDFSKGGVVQYVFEVCRTLAQKDHEMTLVVGNNTDVPESWHDHGSSRTPHAIKLGRPPGKQGWLNNASLLEMIQLALQNDVVHLHGAWDLGSIRFAKQLSKHRIPYVVSTHGMLDDWSLQQKPLKKKISLRLFAARFLRRAGAVHCTAQAECDQVAGNVGGLKHLVCVPPIISLPQSSANTNESQVDVYEAYPNISEEKTKLLFMSRIHVKKGLERLLDALAIIKSIKPLIQLLIAGPGEAKYINSLKSRASRLGISEDILWLGMVREPLKSMVFRESDLFVLTTYQENFGIVLVEAMAMGLPVLTTRGTDIYRELEQGGASITGFDPKEISESIARLVEDPQELVRRGIQGEAFVRDWLDESKVIDGHLELYEQAVVKTKQGLERRSIAETSSLQI